MADRGIVLGTRRGGPVTHDESGIYKRKLRALKFQMIDPSPAAKPNKAPVANLSGPRAFHVCILKDDDYITVSDLRSCTGLAVYDPASKLGAAYHFGGHANLSDEETELGKFAAKLREHHVELGKLQMWLFGTDKCAFADRFLDYLKPLGFTQTPTVMEMHVESNMPAAFHLLGTGIVTNQLT